MVNLEDLASALRRRQGDTLDVEVKSAAGKDGRGAVPADLHVSLCALSNLPGGGWVLLGLDESDGFRPVGLTDVQVLLQGVAQKARMCVPPVMTTSESVMFEGSEVVVVRVAECDPAMKPCRVQNRGWIRGYDGDFQMSDLEEQAFLRLRQAPLHDREPVPHSSREDLDDALVALWLATARMLDPQGLGRFDDDDVLLARAGVVHPSGALTRAGLLTLGVYPQQFIPRFVVTLAEQAPGTRARDLVTLSGPIPALLEGALDWARRVFRRDVVVDLGGSVRDRYEYPLEAFRELVGNALVHRDLDAWSEHKAVEVRLAPGKLVVTNPGGLYGITVDRLGQPGTSSPRNGRLVQLCQYARTTDDARVVETLASGIPRVLETVAAAGLKPPSFYDAGLQFTALLRIGDPDLPTEMAGRNATQQVVYRAITSAGHPLSVAQIADATGAMGETVRKAVRVLVRDHLLAQHGGRGRATTYSLYRPDRT
jgi:ATP-dependent DNA helicase RecG